MTEPMQIPGEMVIVSGNATVEMRPDAVSFNVGVETEGVYVRAIVRENSEKVARILEFLKAHDVKSEEIRTSSFDLASVERDEKKVGYRVSNSIGVTRRSAADVGDLIAGAIETGANEVHGPQFTVQNEKVVQERCLDIAFADAQKKAKRLAVLSERKLGKVMAVTDGSSSPFEFKYRSPGVEGGVVGGIAIEAGVHVVECGVTIAFQLK